MLKFKLYISILAVILAFAAHLVHSADSSSSDPSPSQIQADPIPTEPKNDAPSQHLVLDQNPEFIQAIEDLGLLQMRQGHHAEAKALFEQALALQPDNDKWRSLANTATFWTLLKEASVAREKKLFDVAEKNIRSALLIEPDNAEGLAVLGGILLDRDNFSEAEKSFRAALKHEPDNSSAIYGLTSLLAQQGRRKEALALLDSLGDEQSTAGKKFVSIRTSLLRDEADALAVDSKMDQAVATLKHALTLSPQDAWIRFDLARLYQKQKAMPQAEAIMTEGLQAAPNDMQMPYAYALFLHGIDREHEALRMLDKIPPAERTPSMHALQQKIEQASQDQKKKTPVLKDSEHPVSTQPVAGEYGAEAYVAGGLNYRNKPGTSGISSLKTREQSLIAHIPIKWGGYALIQLDTVNVHAGTLPFSDFAALQQYGKIQAQNFPSAASVNAPTQEDSGVALALGYENERLRVDIGTTPLGFAVHHVVGGLKLRHSFDAVYASLDLSKRPVTSSLVSYAGARDPVTGEVWGGVSSSGANVRVGYDRGRFSAFSSLGYHLLAGKNVLDNSQLELRPGVDWTFISTENMRINAGLVYTYWRYKENLRYYSFGHGGYYSPQSYQSLSIPARWTGRSGRWSYLLKGALTASFSKEKAMPYYPTDSGLQAAVPNAIYAGGSSNGTGYSLGAALEYQSTPRVFLGARFEIDRSEYYTPNFMAVYARYMFDTHTAPIPFPPDPVEPYSRY